MQKLIKFALIMVCFVSFASGCATTGSLRNQANDPGAQQAEAALQALSADIFAILFKSMDADNAITVCETYMKETEGRIESTENCPADIQAMFYNAGERIEAMKDALEGKDQDGIMTISEAISTLDSIIEEGDIVYSMYQEVNQMLDALEEPKAQ